MKQKKNKTKKNESTNNNKNKCVNVQLPQRLKSIEKKISALRRFLCHSVQKFEKTR